MARIPMEAEPEHLSNPLVHLEFKTLSWPDLLIPSSKQT